MFVDTFFFKNSMNVQNVVCQTQRFVMYFIQMSILLNRDIVWFGAHDVVYKREGSNS